MPNEGTRQQIERRNIVSSIFVVVLIGLAYQEMVVPVRDAVRAHGITLGTAILFIIFFLTSMRFFVGNQLHLMSDALVKMPGGIWFYDLMVIILQTVVLIFLGGVTSVQVSRSVPIGFIKLLIVLYLLDVVWIISQWFLGKLIPKWKREFIPWAWCILNISLILSFVLLSLFIGDLYSDRGLIFLGIFNTVAFVLDVLLVDYYDMV